MNVKELEICANNLLTPNVLHDGFINKSLIAYMLREGAISKVILLCSLYFVFVGMKQTSIILNYHR